MDPEERPGEVRIDGILQKLKESERKLFMSMTLSTF